MRKKLILREGYSLVRHLHKVFREKTSTEYHEIYKKRQNYESVVKLPFKIKPMDQADLFDLYYIPTQNMISYISEIYYQDKQLENLVEELPPIAMDNLILELLAEELQNTNEIEGVQSTKDEIVRSAKEISLDKRRNARFGSMIKSYQALLKGEEVGIDSSQEIRTIYDNITQGEIKQDEFPDGKLFRIEPTFVYKKSGSGKVIHKGITPERNIIELMEQLIQFMNDENVPLLIRIAVGHYYFGYIHPFYDGNGRTGRYISSVFIKKEFSKLTALSLSRGCNSNRNMYLQSFEFTNSFANRGEMNFFIESFLYIISEAQKELIFNVKQKVSLLNKFYQQIVTDREINERCKSFMFILAQNYFFAVGEKGLTTKELAKIVEKSEQYVRSVMKELANLGVIDQMGERPIIYTISEKYFD